MVKTYRIFTGAPKIAPRDETLQVSVETVDKSTQFHSICPDNQSQSYLQSIAFQDDESEESKALGIKSGYGSLLHQNNSTISFLRVDDKTYETCEGSTMLSEGSSVSRFPTFNFSLDHITSLPSLTSIAHNQKPRFLKTNLLVSVLEVDGPLYITTKNKQHPEEMALLKLMIGDDGGQICRLVVWRETAEIWGGLSSDDPGLKRGDVVCFENVVLTNASNRSEPSLIELVASPSHKSTAQVCYRTAASTKEDQAFCPDLRLAHSIPCVRRVSEMVIWMQQTGYIY